MEDRHIIWSNENLDLDDWREDLQEQYPDCSEDELYRIMCETNADYLSDERVNLNIQLSQPILVIADLGLWNGRRMGYKEIPSGNIRDCLSGGYDYTTWYVDKKGDFRCDDIHHDGINHYLYRVYKDGVSEYQKDRQKRNYTKAPPQDPMLRGSRDASVMRSARCMAGSSRQGNRIEVKPDESKRYDRAV